MNNLNVQYRYCKDGNRSGSIYVDHLEHRRERRQVMTAIIICSCHTATILAIMMNFCNHSDQDILHACAALPDNATNITVYGLRPHQLGSTLVDKDTGDAAGDLFFFLGDRLLIPMACRHDPGW